MKRHCKKCGKVLADLNTSGYCFYHQKVTVIDYDEINNVIFKRDFDDASYTGLITLCSSRVTSGFNRVFIEYHGSGLRHL